MGSQMDAAGTRPCGAAVTIGAEDRQAWSRPDIIEDSVQAMHGCAVTSQLS
jgi:hypothetical protein